MKIFIDILTPKQVMLFSKLSERLRKKGHEVFEATRDYREVIELLNMKGIKAKKIGKHGGNTLHGKLRASVKRTLELTSIVHELRPHVAISFSSPETSRVAFGLGIPHVCLNDSPHAEAVARLSIPLCAVLLTPRIIPKTAWTKYGIAKDRITQYNALDPWAWLKDFKPDEHILAQLGLERSLPIVVFRPEESYASYLFGKASRTPAVVPLIDSLLKSNVDFQAVVIPRYEYQAKLLGDRLGRRVKLCRSVVDASSLLSYTSVFVGSAGTMTAEAALLGVPAFSCYPDKPILVERFLMKKGLLVRNTDLKKVKVRVLNILNNLEVSRNEQAAKAQKLTSGFEDPIDVILESVEKVV
jgi:predicted glycosyltransferase